MSSSRKYQWLAAIVAAEAFLFLWKSNHFFNGDSLFFFSHQIHNWADIVRVFSSPDHLWQYRPLTFVIFSFLLKPIFGTDPLGYNIFPFFVHAANTFIVFGIFRRLGLTERAALLGTFFFGAHSTAFYITYGVAFLPDLSYSFFYLLSLFWFLKYLRQPLYRYRAWSLLLFLLALSCKEAAITLPVVVFTISFLWGDLEFHRRQASIIPAVKAAFARTFHFLFFGIVYLSFHLLAKSGQVYAPGIDHPHYAELSIYALQSKYRYLKWAFNLPDGLIFSFQGFSNYLVAGALLFIAFPFVLWAISRLWKRDRITWCGCIWFIAALSPVLFLRNLTMNHNLYIPVVGLALVFGHWMDEVLDRSAARGHKWTCRAIPAYVLVYLTAVFFLNVKAADNSWIAQASMIAETSLRDLKDLRPVLPDGATLYFVDRSSLGSLRWYYDYGSLVRLFYPAKSLNIQFIDRGYKLPEKCEMPAGAIVFEYDGYHLTEVTGRI